MISAKVIADSKNEFGNRITTMVVVMPRYILAEFNTHRMLSKNSASSRAIPFKKNLKNIEENPFIPIAWMKDHKGMQGTEYFTNELCDDEQGENGERNTMVEMLEHNWLLARDYALEQAKNLSNKGLKWGKGS